jgi:hypothetical protein
MGRVTDISTLQPGQRVRVHQTIERREGDWRPTVVGTVVAVRAQKTGSWYAHAKDDQLWLRRLELRKDDGELTTITLDQHSVVELAAAGTPTS